LLDSVTNVKVQGGFQAASNGGHDAIVQRLLELGTDINAQGRYYGKAL
jgi:hypothetical protein